MGFEWDEVKNQANIIKHGIDFIRAKEIFNSPVLETVDDRYDYGESRVIAIGVTNEIELAVVYTMHGDVRRIISARRARRDERRAYRQAYPG
ncbi:MAG TPA: BrnT family toxin [Dehalococcoidia bacterium]|jgi:uncharacterized DUF497 family protein|nr:BrnT family toxin [Dehalococcoidia bacterium]